jgi:hypothetical protein
MLNSRFSLWAMIQSAALYLKGRFSDPLNGLQIISDKELWKPDSHLNSLLSKEP